MLPPPPGTGARNRSRRKEGEPGHFVSGSSRRKVGEAEAERVEGRWGVGKAVKDKRGEEKERENNSIYEFGPSMPMSIECKETITQLKY